jgi:hypothetical protein
VYLSASWDFLYSWLPVHLKMIQSAGSGSLIYIVLSNSCRYFQDTRIVPPVIKQLCHRQSTFLLGGGIDVRSMSFPIAIQTSRPVKTLRKSLFRKPITYHKRWHLGPCVPYYGDNTVPIWGVTRGQPHLVRRVDSRPTPTIGHAQDMDPLSSISPRSPALSYLDIIHHFCGRLVDGYGYGNGGYEKGVVGVIW